MSDSTKALICSRASCLLDSATPSSRSKQTVSAPQVGALDNIFLFEPGMYNNERRGLAIVFELGVVLVEKDLETIEVDTIAVVMRADDRFRSDFFVVILRVVILDDFCLRG